MFRHSMQQRLWARSSLSYAWKLLERWYLSSNKAVGQICSPHLSNEFIHYIFSNCNNTPPLLRLSALAAGSTFLNMDDNIAPVTALVNDTRSREPDPVSQLISSFLIARSRTFRELAELRDEVSELLARLFLHNTLIHK